MKIELKKYHSIGNEYVIFDPQVNNVQLNQEQIQYICKEKFGFDADGIITGPLYKEGKLWMEAYNPDGTENQQKENGARIFAEYLKDAGYVSKESIDICTKTGDISIQMENENKMPLVVGHIRYQISI